MAYGNGCGPAWLDRFAVTRWIKARLFNWFFEASCDRHDEGYRRGGDEIRRFECDWKFFQAMRRDILRKRGLARLVRWIQALVFFALVRALGWRHFNYRDPIPDSEELDRAYSRVDLAGLYRRKPGA